METRLVKVLGKNGRQHIVAFYTGVTVLEMSSLLKVLIGGELAQVAIGLEDDDGVTIPISVACQHPHILTASRYHILLAESHVDPNRRLLIASSNDTVKAGDDDHQPDSSVGEIVSSLVRLGKIKPKDQQMLGQLAEAHDARLAKAITEYKKSDNVDKLVATLISIANSSGKAALPVPQTRGQQLVRFVEVLRKQGIISEKEERLLHDLIKSRDGVINAAYEVAEHEHDVEALRNMMILRIRMMLPPEVRLQQITLLEVLKLLIERNLIGSSGGRYLMYKIMNADNIMLAACEAFEMDHDVEELMDTLIRAVKIGLKGGSSPQNGQMTNLSAPKHIEMLDLLLNAGKLSPQETTALQGLAEGNNEYLLAAFEAFSEDKDVDELVDTLRRVARLRAKAEVTENAEDEDDDSTDEETVANEFAIAYPTQELLRLIDDPASMKHIDESQAIEARHLVNERNVLLLDVLNEYRSTGSKKRFYRSLLKIVRRKSNTAPQPKAAVSQFAEGPPASFVSILDELESKKIFSPSEVAFLKHIWRDDDIVRATWEVYVVNPNIGELVDTLRRVIRNSPLSKSSEVESLLLSTIDSFETKGLLTRTEVSILKGLARSKDDVLIASYNIWLGDKNLGDFLDTMKRLVRREVEPSSEHQSEEKIMSELGELVEELHRDRKINKNELAVIKNLIIARDPAILAIYDVYQPDNDIEELVDSLVALGRSHTHPSKGDFISTTVRYSTTQQLEIMDLLEQSQTLTAFEADIASELIEAGDERMLAVFDAYQYDHDVANIVDSIQRLVTLEKNRVSKPVQTSSFKSLPVEHQLIQIVTEMDLTELETKALRRKIAENDSFVKAALEVFRLEQDPEDLKDTLARIAKRAVVEDQQEATISSKVLAKEIVDEMNKAGFLSLEEYTTLEQMAEASRSPLLRALERYDTAGDIEALIQDLKDLAAQEQ